MDWSPQQSHALDLVRDWLRSSEQVFRLFGYAGTGKTTLAKHLAEDAGKVLFGAFTGKAAYVLRRKGCSEATTIHKLIYQPKDRGRQHLLELEEELAEALRQGVVDVRRASELRAEIVQEKENLKRPLFVLNPDSPVREADLLVVDECSMVDEHMGRDLLSFGRKVLVLGDPAQLPPVAGTGFFINARPDMLLTEIHRQARENPIIRLATAVREGHDPVLGQYGDSVVMDWADVTEKEATEADQILVGTNRLRQGTNRRMRELQGRQGSLPEEGDRLVCLRNDHKVGLLNGAIWTVKTVFPKSKDDRVNLEVTPEEGGEPIEVEAHTSHFLGRELPFRERRQAQEFDYGYALTVHKAQGSQWCNVLIFDESRRFGQDKRRWLYTALTRASDRVTLVR